METNETPEKIYINSNLENRTWLIGKGDISFIEYIKKDAFIEKTCEWLKNNLSQKVSVISSGYVHINFDNAIKEFRKYMEKK